MSEPLDPHDPASLLAYDRFIRGLARTLVLDESRADDVAQQTWVAVLTHRWPSDGLRAWLTTLVRRFVSNARRRDVRQLRREQMAARAAHTPSAPEIREREAARHAVVEAVLALDEPYQTTMVLRYLQGLPPRAISKRMGVPVETVRTRARRGLEQLRLHLDREHGGNRVAWCISLLPLARAEPALALGALHAFLPGALLVTTKTKLILAALICVAVSLGLWKTVLAPSPAPATPAPQIASSGTPLQVTKPASAPDSSIAVTRREIAPPTQATAGSLWVHVEWQDDRQPAAGIVVHVYRFAFKKAVFPEWETVTDAHGDARIDGLPPETVRAQTDRASGEEVKIVAGRETKLEITLPPACNVEGLVVDARGTPVANAEVRLTSRIRVGHAVSARSATDGTFCLRGVTRNYSLEARATGYAPSLRYVVQGGAGKTVRMTLILPEFGGSVAGIVRDPSGVPVGHAIVEIGEPSLRQVRLEDGSTAYAPAAIDSFSDTLGTFRVQGIAAGKQKLVARAAGFAPFVGDVFVVAGGESSVTVDLVPGATLEGTITGSDGTPAEHVRISVGKGGGVFLEATSTYTRIDGTYVLSDLLPGEFEVVADANPLFDSSPGSTKQGKARTRLIGRSGEHLRWDARLELGLSIHGRVSDERGRPVVGATVRGVINAIDGYMGRASTDKEGKFTLTDCKDAPTEIEVRVRDGGLFPQARLEGVRPGPDEVLITLADRDRASVYITGTVFGVDGTPVPAMVGAQNLEVPASLANAANPESGEFRLGPYPPGWWALRVDAPGHASLMLPHRELLANETWHLGDLRLVKAGFASVRAKDANGKLITKALFLVRSEIHGFPSGLAINDGTGQSEPLAPGKYVLRAHAHGCADACLGFEITSGSETPLEVMLQPGVTQAVRLQTASGDTTRVVHVCLRDAEGRSIADESLWAGKGEWTWNLGLAPGTYHLEATTPNGRRGTADIVIKTAASEQPTIVLVR